jgi:hypothetical protein
MLTNNSLQNNQVFRGNFLKVERKAFRHVGTPKRVRSQAFTRPSATPRTPRDAAAARSPMAASGAAHSGAARFSTARREELLRAPPPVFAVPVPPAHGQGYAFPNVPPPMAPIPPVGPNGQPVLGASGLPVTPSASTPFIGPNGYNFRGGMWLGGMTMYRDPVTGQEFWSCTPPIGGTHGGPPAPTPTRGHEQHHYRG